MVYKPCTGKHAEPGDMYWSYLSREPYSKREDAVADLPGLLDGSSKNINF